MLSVGEEQHGSKLTAQQTFSLSPFPITHTCTSSLKWLMHKVSTNWPYFVWTCIVHRPLLLILEQVLFFGCEAGLFPQWHFVLEPIIQTWKITSMQCKMEMNVYNARWLRAYENENCTAFKFMFSIRKITAVPWRNATTERFGIDCCWGLMRFLFILIWSTEK